MKTIIAGGRNFIPSKVHTEWLNTFIDDTTEVVSGGAVGADSYGERWAKYRHIPVKIFSAMWDVYGKIAGYKRNKQMAKYADRCLLFPGGKGTAHMKKLALEYGLEVHEFEREEREWHKC